MSTLLEDPMSAPDYHMSLGSPSKNTICCVRARTCAGTPAVRDALGRGAGGMHRAAGRGDRAKGGGSLRAGDDVCLLGVDAGDAEVLVVEVVDPRAPAVLHGRGDTRVPVANT